MVMDDSMIPCSSTTYARKAAPERGRILRDALTLINGTRQDQYGNPEDNFQTIADLWAAYTGRPFSAHDVAVMMALMKCARIRTGSGTEDSYTDACGYLALAADMPRGGDDGQTV